MTTRSLTFPTLVGLISEAVLLGTAAAEAGTGVEAWNAERARLFSQVCMAAAPDFSGFELAARVAGMDPTADGMHFDPEVLVSLEGDANNCACYMTAGAPDAPGLIKTVSDRLVADYPDLLGAVAEQGPLNEVDFEMSGVQVHLTLATEPYEGNDWLIGLVKVPEACPL